MSAPPTGHNDTGGGENEALARSAEEGDVEALAKFFELSRRRLTQMVALRIHPRVRVRVSPSDVVQEAYLDAAARLDRYAHEKGRMPIYLWLRYLAGQRLLQEHRRHLGPERDAGRDVSLNRRSAPDAGSAGLASRLVGKGTSPSGAAGRAELRARVEEALNSMEPLDKEVLVLRHFEHLSGVETARVLEIQISAASKRYVRALKRLGEILGSEIAAEQGLRRGRG